MHPPLSKTKALFFTRFSLLRKHFGEEVLLLKSAYEGYLLPIPKSLSLLNIYIALFLRVMELSLLYTFNDVSVVLTIWLAVRPWRAKRDLKLG